MCWWLGLQGSGRHIKALSLKSSKLVVNLAWNPACMPVNQGFFEIINHFLIKFFIFFLLVLQKKSIKKIRNSLDIEKIWNGVILNLNNMISVPEQEIQEVSISQIEDEKYRRLLKRQADYIRAYSEKIQIKQKNCIILLWKGSRGIYMKKIY